MFFEGLLEVAGKMSSKKNLLKKKFEFKFKSFLKKKGTFFLVEFAPYLFWILEQKKKEQKKIFSPSAFILIFTKLICLTLFLSLLWDILLL